MWEGIIPGQPNNRMGKKNDSSIAKGQIKLLEKTSLWFLG